MSVHVAPVRAEAHNARASSDDGPAAAAALPLAPISAAEAALDLSAVSVDEDSAAFEYLASVRAQAQKLPAVLSANVKPSQSSSTTGSTASSASSSASSSRGVQSLSSLLSRYRPPSCPERFSANVAWQNHLASGVADLRLVYERYEKQRAHESRAAHAGLPKRKDWDGWLHYCLGDALLHSTSDDQQSNRQLQGDAKSASKSMWHPPTLSVLRRLDQIATRALLRRMFGVLLTHARTLQQTSHRPADVLSAFPSSVFPRCLALWLFALLVRLQKPLHAEMAAALLAAFKCILTMRATAAALLLKMESAESGARLVRELHAAVLHCNVALTLIDKLFGQRVSA
jgi:hypothetical protein